ncbi:MAG: hypothetical protein HEQ19_28445 [Gloeotrichia echinulata CP02]
MSFVICHLSFVICHLSFVICHLSFVICHLSFVRILGVHMGKSGFLALFDVFGVV